SHRRQIEHRQRQRHSSMSFQNRATDIIHTVLLRAARTIKIGGRCTARRTISHHHASGVMYVVARALAKPQKPGPEGGGKAKNWAEPCTRRGTAKKPTDNRKRPLPRKPKARGATPPAKNPAELIGEFDRVTADLTRLIQQINRTNAATAVA